MAGARLRHNRIATNVTIALGARLRGRRCEVFNSDVKVRIDLPTHVRFYYPDASVMCQPPPVDQEFHESPTIVVEVLSRATRRIDEREKRSGYLQIPSLAAYLLVEQRTACVIVYRSTKAGFVREFYEGLGAVIPLREIEVELPLVEIYERVEPQS